MHVALITAPGAIITSVQFGIGSYNAGGNVYVNQLETNFYRSGDVTTFGPFPPVYNVTQATYHGTIQDAVDNANPGDVIDIDPGTYAENVTVDKMLTLNGSGSGSDPGTNTVLTPSSPGITITSGGTSAVNRLVISNLHITGDIYGEDSVEVLGDKICHVHIKDMASATPDDEIGHEYLAGRFKRALLNEGVVDHLSLFRGLKKIGYEGFLSCEASGGDEPLVVAQHELTEVRKLLNQA